MVLSCSIPELEKPKYECLGISQFDNHSCLDSCHVWRTPAQVLSQTRIHSLSLQIFFGAPTNPTRFMPVHAASRVPGQCLHKVIDRAGTGHFQVKSRGRSAGHSLAHLELHAGRISCWRWRWRWDGWIWLDGHPREPCSGSFSTILVISFPSPVEDLNAFKLFKPWNWWMSAGIWWCANIFWGGYAICSSWKCWALSARSCPLKPGMGLA